MRNLYESIMHPELDVVRGVEAESILKSHHWWGVKSVEWIGKTLKVIFNGRGYMPDFLEVAEELGTKSFHICPWAIIDDIPELDGFDIRATTKLDIHCPKIKNCTLKAGHRVSIFMKHNGTLDFVRNDIQCTDLLLDNINRGTFVGNKFDEIDRLALSHVGPTIDKRVVSWNILSVHNGKWATWPVPKEKVDLKLDPLKTLGLDKHFKNVKDFKVARSTSSDDIYIWASRGYKRNRYDWGIRALVDLDNGWQLRVESDARSI